MSFQRSSTENPRLEVIKAIEQHDPAYVPAWYSFFASETLERYGDRLRHLLAGYDDDLVFAVLSTFPPMAEMDPGWTDEWGCSWMHASGGVGAVSISSPLYEGWERLPWYLKHGLPELGKRTDLLDRVSAARAANPERYLVATTWLAVFERLRALRGTENLLMDLYLHPKELEMLRDAIVEEFLDQIRGIAARGADGVLLADDFGTQTAMLLSPGQWRRFFRHCYERMVAEIHALDMHAWFHSCGNIRPIIPDLVDIGFDVLHPLQPSAMDLVEIRQTFGGQICFAGAVDVQALLPLADSEHVTSEIRRTIDILDGPHGGYIVAPTNSIMPDTPFDNIKAMCSTMREYGHEKRQAKA
ncbi:MAG: uroporphyrinogen decarboxylase family protein [Chloroflexota bacterium]|nr:uroporphyrinogen decarboxylase family protein [Anaerolineae bacterium]